MCESYTKDQTPDKDAEEKEDRYSRGSGPWSGSKYQKI